jgi:hypothetical protein
MMAYEFQNRGASKNPWVQVKCAYCEKSFLTSEPDDNICSVCAKKHNVCTGFPVSADEAKERLTKIEETLSSRGKMRGSCTFPNVCYGFVFED